MLRTRTAVAVAGVLAATVAAAPAHAACAGADVLPSSANGAKVRKATLCLLNVQRRAHRLRKLRENAKLRHAAAGYSRLMVRQGFFSHVSPGGSTLESRINGTFRDIGIGITTGAPIPAGAAARGGTYTTDFGYRG